MRMERDQRISVKRLMLGVVVEAALFTVFIAFEMHPLLWVFATLGIAGVVIVGAVPDPSVTAGTLIIVAAFVANFIATFVVTRLAIHVGPIVGTPPTWGGPDTLFIALPAFA